MVTERQVVAAKPDPKRDYKLAEPLVLGALRKVEARGSIETAHRLRQRAERVFKYAKGLGLKRNNPAVDVSEAMKPVPRSARWPAIVETRAVRALLREIDVAPSHPVTRMAGRFLALTAQRPGMVRHANGRISPASAPPR